MRLSLKLIVAIGGATAAALAACSTRAHVDTEISVGALTEYSKVRIENDDGTHVEVDQPLERRELSPEERQQYEALKPQGPTGVGETKEEYLESLLREWDQTSDVVEVMFDLPDTAPRMDLQPFKEHLDSRVDVVRAREEAFASVRQPLLAAIAEAGGTVVETHWLANQVMARLPGKLVRGLSAVPGVIGWSGNSYKVNPGGVLWDGLDYKNATASTRFTNLGQRGCAGGPGNCSRVAVAEYLVAGTNNYQNRIATNHYGWRRAGSTSSRVVAERNCSVPGCPVEASAPPANPVHGQVVASVIGATVEDGQDPGQTTSVTRQERSGLATAVDIVYLRFSGCNSLALSAQAALFEGAFILNNSNNIVLDGVNSTRPPTQNTNECGLNEMIRSYTDYEGVWVNSAGNSGWIEWPAVRPESVTVGALDSGDDTVPYTSTQILAGSGIRDRLSLCLGFAASTVGFSGCDAPST